MIEDYTQESCCNCGTIIWLHKLHRRNLLRNKSAFYCPNGHPQHYTGDTEEQKHQKELEAKDNHIQQLLSEITKLTYVEKTKRKNKK